MMEPLIVMESGQPSARHQHKLDMQADQQGDMGCGDRTVEEGAFSVGA